MTVMIIFFGVVATSGLFFSYVHHFLEGVGGVGVRHVDVVVGGDQMVGMWLAAARQGRLGYAHAGGCPRGAEREHAGRGKRGTKGGHGATFMEKLCVFL